MKTRIAGPMLLIIPLLMSLSGCSKPDERLIDLEARFGDPTSIDGSIKYDAKRMNNVVERELEVELENGKRGDIYVVTLDGVSLGEVTIDADGEGKLDLSDDGNDAPFPADFVEPKVGSVVKVGDLFEGPMTEKVAAPKKP